MKTLRYLFTLFFTVIILGACQENQIKTEPDEELADHELDDLFYGEITETRARRVTLVWDAQPGTLMYRIFRAETKSPFADPEALKYQKILETSETIFTDKDLTSEMYYYYKVQAHFGSGKVTGTSALVALTLPMNPYETGYEKLSDLGKLTGGVMLEAESHQVVPATIIKILKENIVEADADVMLLIDNTNSMSDDIGEIKKNLNSILDVLQNTTRVGMATFSDLNDDPDHWFGFHDLTKDLTSVRTFLNNIKLMGGGDLQESVYDGVYETLTRTSWSQKKRIIIVIGDNIPLEGDRTRHTYEDVLKKSKESGVMVKLFPIMIKG